MHFRPSITATDARTLLYTGQEFGVLPEIVSWQRTLLPSKEIS